MINFYLNVLSSISKSKHEAHIITLKDLRNTQILAVLRTSKNMVKKNKEKTNYYIASSKLVFYIFQVRGFGSRKKN